MKQFELAVPKTISEAIELLPAEWDEDGGRQSAPIAGGQDIITVLKEGIHSPEALIHLRGISGLEGVREFAGGGLRVGSMTKLVDLAQDAKVRSGWRALSEAAEGVGSPQIRNLATLGGNLCQRPRCWYYRNSDAPCLKKGGYECFAYGGKNKYNAILGGGPSYIVHPSDIAPALQMLGADVRAQSATGSRLIPMEEFYTLPADGDVTRETVLGANEVIDEVRIRKQPDGLRTTYAKARERGSFDFALSAVALGVRLDGDEIAECRIVLGSVAPIPWRAVAAESLAIGMRNTSKTWSAVAEKALDGAEPLSENGYKIPLTRGLIEKAFRRLSQEAG